MQPIIDAIANEIFVLVPLFAIGIGIIAVTGGLIASHYRNKSFERSRREIAAYIAEGSISPEEGERLLQVKPQKGGGGCGCG